MARIPTYESQVTQVTPQQFQHTENPIGVAIKGVAQGLGTAGGVIESVQDYQNVKEDKTYKLNQAPRENAITNSILDLNSENKKIREKLANAPNPEEANKLLDEHFNKISNNPPQGLDKKSLEKWQRALYATQRSLKLQNLNWGETAASRAGKAAEEKSNRDLYAMLMNNALRAGQERSGYTYGQFSIDKKGRYSEYHIPSLDAKNKQIDDAQHAKYFIGMSTVPLETNPDDPNVPGILGNNLNAISGELEKEGWSIGGVKLGSDKYKTKQQVGTEKINQYFDDIREDIDTSGLSASEKNALKSYADAQQRARQREFNAYVKASNLELQRQMGQIPEPGFIAEYLENKLAEQKADDELELNPIGENRTVADIRTSDELANLMFDNDYQTVATRYSYAPLGMIDDFSPDLKTAIASLNIPVGDYTREELYQKYAPGRTINEIQAVESLIKDNPYINLVGEDIDAMKPENGFNESEWAHSVMQDIAAMPSSSPEEKERKQAAINHVLYQAQKEINGGLGFQDKNLGSLFQSVLTGTSPVSKEGVPVISPQNLGELKKLTRALIDSENPYQRKQSWSIINKGMRDAINQFREDGDANQLNNAVKKINQDVLAERYFGVIDINDLQQKLDNHKPAIFIYNDRPYEYLGFSGNDVYIKLGKKTGTLGE